jgi:purine-binding chemotaxis protein CheW
VAESRAGERTRARLARLDRRRGDREKNLVGFNVGDVHYAVEVARVREIIRPLPVVTLPHAPPAIVGVADHRSEVVPILDVRRRFGLAEAARTRRTKWILVMLATRTVGLVVDGVSEVFGVGEVDRRPVPTVGTGDAARGIQAVYTHRGALVFVLDVDRIGAAAELIDVSGRAPLLSRGGVP